MKILFLLILISLSGCLEKPETRIFNQAKKASASKNYEKAISLFEKLIQSSTNNDQRIAAAENLISIYEVQADFSNMSKKLQFVVVNSKDRNKRVQAKQKIADMEFSKLKNYSSAITHYSELIELGFNKNKNKMMVSRCYYYLNNFDQALHEIETILSNTKNRGLQFEGLLLKSHILFAQKKYKDSAKLYAQIISEFPKPSKTNFVLLNLAMSMEEDGQYEGAIKALQELQTFYHSPDFLAAKIHHIQKKRGMMPGGKGRLKR